MIYNLCAETFRKIALKSVRQYYVFVFWKQIVLRGFYPEQSRQFLFLIMPNKILRLRKRQVCRE